RSAPPKVIRTTFRSFCVAAERASSLEGSKVLPRARPAASRRNSRRFRESCRMTGCEEKLRMGGHIGRCQRGYTRVFFAKSAQTIENKWLNFRSSERE